MKKTLTSTVLLCTVLLCTVLLNAACSVKQLDKQDVSPSSAKTYELVREEQYVQRYNCTGHIVSSKIETVSSPTKWVEITPQSTFNLLRSEFQNLTNGSRAGLITGHSMFQIDIAPTWLNMLVQEGLNEIEYRFYYCDQFQNNLDGTPSTNCAVAPVLREQGRLFIRVVYSIRSREGISSQRPTPESCVKN